MFPARGSVFWRSWARVIRGRLPVIGRPNADILHHGPPPAYAHGREAVGGAEAGVAGLAAGGWVHPARRRARGTHARQACERRAAGWRVPAEPTTLQLNPQVFPSPLVAPPLPKSCGARSERTNHVRQPAFAEVVPPIGIGGTPPVFTGVRGLATAGCAPLPGHYRAGCRVFSCSRTQA